MSGVHGSYQVTFIKPDSMTVTDLLLSVPSLLHDIYWAAKMCNCLFAP